VLAWQRGNHHNLAANPLCRPCPDHLCSRSFQLAPGSPLPEMREFSLALESRCRYHILLDWPRIAADNTVDCRTSIHSNFLHVFIRYFDSQSACHQGYDTTRNLRLERVRHRHVLPARFVCCSPACRMRFKLSPSHPRVFTCELGKDAPARCHGGQAPSASPTRHVFVLPRPMARARRTTSV
jgi:hypothetical protein